MNSIEIISINNIELIKILLNDLEIIYKTKHRIYFTAFLQIFVKCANK